MTPERIWAFPIKDWFRGGCSTHPVKDRSMAKDVEYIRADVSDALVAAALAKAMDACEGEFIEDPQTDDDETYQSAIADCIVAISQITPNDVADDVDRRIAEAVEAERERVLRLILDEVKYDAYALSRSCVDAIRAGE